MKVRGTDFTLSDTLLPLRKEGVVVELPRAQRGVIEPLKENAGSEGGNCNPGQSQRSENYEEVVKSKCH